MQQPGITVSERCKQLYPGVKLNKGVISSIGKTVARTLRQQGYTRFEHRLRLIDGATRELYQYSGDIELDVLDKSIHAKVAKINSSSKPKQQSLDFFFTKK